MNRNSARRFGRLRFVGEGPGNSSLDWACRDVAAALERLPGEADHVSPAAPAEPRLCRIERDLLVFFLLPEPSDVLASVDAGLLRDNHVIAYACGDAADMRRQLERRLEWIDEIWVPSRFALDALGELAKPAHVVPLPVRGPEGTQYPRSRFQLMGQRTVFLAVLDAAASLQGQNPGAAIEAFRAAFPDRPDVEMVILLQNAAAARGLFRTLSDLVGADARIWYWDVPLSHAETLGLISTADAFVSLHRENTFGVAIAQAMRAGTTVITTQLGGSAEYTNPSNALTIPLRPGASGEADHDAAVRAFQRVAADRNAFRDMIATARSHDFAALFERAVLDRLGRIEAGRANREERDNAVS
ncbi:glycosyltransferase [Marinicauda algicola]|uniref:glycosyltransferase n=1 Tax=Marinicauda algicola TaxID=2029849 RepID=UPI0013051050|nr:glycosyltransferase [Marinicauda algicola]